jgi:hypothetical protein
MHYQQKHTRSAYICRTKLALKLTRLVKLRPGLLAVSHLATAGWLPSVCLEMT